MSRPYFFLDDTTWCVRRAKQIPKWKNFFFVCDIEVLYIGIFYIVISIPIIYGLRLFDDPNPGDIWTTGLIVFLAVLLMPAHIQPKQITFRFFAGFFLLVLLMLTSTYLAFFFNFLITPLYEKQIHTFDHLVNEHFLLAGAENTKTYLEKEKLVKYSI